MVKRFVIAEVESVTKTTLKEIENVLSTKTIVGEPMTIAGNTLIPLISIGFGFGAGASTGMEGKKRAKIPVLVG